MSGLERVLLGADLGQTAIEDLDANRRLSFLLHLGAPVSGGYRGPLVLWQTIHGVPQPVGLIGRG